MVRVGRLLKFFQVARDACRGKTCKHTAGMAAAASEANMRAGQWERGLRMIECCA